MREFRLFKHPSGAFEVVPVGWSFWALFLHLFWAIGNGLFIRFTTYFIPAIALIVIGAFLLDTQQSHVVGEFFLIAALVYGNGFAFYFSFVAHDWRADALTAQGYEQIAAIRGRTGHEALSGWARSSQADEVLDSTSVRYVE